MLDFIVNTFAAIWTALAWLVGALPPAVTVLLAALVVAFAVALRMTRRESTRAALCSDTMRTGREPVAREIRKEG